MILTYPPNHHFQPHPALSCPTISLPIITHWPPSSPAHTEGSPWAELHQPTVISTQILLLSLPSLLFYPHFFHPFVSLFSPSASPLPRDRNRLRKLAVTWNPLNKDNTPKLTFSSLSSSLVADKPDKQNFNCLTFHIQFDDGKILKTTCIQTNTNLSLWHFPSVPLHLTFIQSFPLPFSPLLDVDKPLNYLHHNYVCIFFS